MSEHFGTSVFEDFVHFFKTRPREVDAVLAVAKVEGLPACPNAISPYASALTFNRGGSTR